MAVPTDPHVHLEAVETAKDAQEETSWTGTARMGGLRRSLQSERLLEDGRDGSAQQGTHKRKTDTLRLL